LLWRAATFRLDPPIVKCRNTVTADIAVKLLVLDAKIQVAQNDSNRTQSVRQNGTRLLPLRLRPNCPPPAYFLQFASGDKLQGDVQIPTHESPRASDLLAHVSPRFAH